MIILKHVEHEIRDTDELIKLQIHLMEASSKIDGVILLDIYFPAEKEEFVIALDCESEEKYISWNEICPSPDGANDWYEIWLTKADKFIT